MLVGLLIAKSALATERGIDFQVDADGLAETRLRAPRELITVVGNLVDNAFDSVARPRNTGGRVTVEARRLGDALSIVVADNGSGISDDDFHRVFEPGFTTKSADTHGGIGLTLVAESVDALGGTIVVERDGGTVFSVSIPNAFDTVASRP